MASLVASAPSIFRKVIGVQRSLDALHEHFSHGAWLKGTAQEPGLPTVQVYARLVCKLVATMLPAPDLTTSKGRASAIARPIPSAREVSSCSHRWLAPAPSVRLADLVW